MVPRTWCGKGWHFFRGFHSNSNGWPAGDGKLLLWLAGLHRPRQAPFFLFRDFSFWIPLLTLLTLLFCYFLLFFFCFYASLLFLLLCLYVFSFSVFCSLLCIFSAFVAFSLFLLASLLFCLITSLATTTWRTAPAAQTTRAATTKGALRTTHATEANKNSNRNKNNYNGKGGTQPKLSLCSLGAGAAPSPMPSFSCFYFVVACFSFCPFWFLCIGV